MELAARMDGAGRGQDFRARLRAALASTPKVRALFKKLAT